MATIKQRKTAEDLLENVGKPIGKAMLDNGYSKSTSENPDHLTKSKGWNELMDKYLSDDFLAEKHKELLNKKEVKTKFDHETGEFEAIPTGELDVQAVSKGLDMAYKLKGKYAPEKKDITSKGEKIGLEDAKLQEEADAFAETLKDGDV